MNAGRLDDAQLAIDRATAGVAASAAAHPNAADSVAYVGATVAAFRGDLPRAQALLEARVPSAATRPADSEASWLHNELTWLRWAEGDLAGALTENAAMGAAIAASTLSDKEKGGLSLHYLWDRAYLLLDLADRATKADRAARLADAAAARAAYEKPAKAAHDHDGMAVLAAYFAVRGGDGKTARTAAATVDAAKDPDLQDLYVLALAFDAGGDSKDAEAIRQRIRTSTNVYLMRPLILRQLILDAAPASAP